MHKLQEFIENTKILNSLGITPLLYGSLGLEYLTGKSLNADDIDILIPKKFLTDKWEEFHHILENAGHVLIDKHEHTFEKNGIHFSYAQIEELETFASISKDDIETVTSGNVSF